MRDIKEIAINLNSLIQLDIDAYHVYGQAIKEIHVPSIKERLSQYREDHKSHVIVLSKIVRDLKGEPPVFSADPKGFFIEGMTAIRGKTGIEGALKAMETNEKLTNDTYSKALAWPVPQEILTTLEKNLHDERAHLAYITDALERRIWEAK